MRLYGREIALEFGDKRMNSMERREARYQRRKARRARKAQEAGGKSF